MASKPNSTSQPAQPAKVHVIDGEEEVRQARAIAALPENLAIIRMENESIQAMAAARPRNHESIKREIAEQLEAYPSFAEEAIYDKPVGKDPETGRMKYARGLSVRAAEAVAEAYGYCRVSTRVDPVDDNTVRVSAEFFDYQKARKWEDSGLVSRYYRARSGRMEKYPDDRFYNVVVKAELSRRVRECILRSVPPGLRAELMETAERKIDSLLDEATVQKIITQFASKHVTLEMLESRVGRTRGAGWTKDDRRDLLALWNAIKDGETTVAEAFPDESQPSDAPPPAATGPVSANDLLDPQAPPAAGKAHEDGPTKKARPGEQAEMLDTSPQYS